MQREVVAYQFQSNKEHIINDKGPLAAVAIAGDTEKDGADGTKHENKGDAPSNVRLGLVKLRGEVGNGQGDGEEVKGIPGLRAGEPRVWLANRKRPLAGGGR